MVNVFGADAGKVPAKQSRAPRIPSMDGLRAVSIGLVLLAHASYSAAHGSGPLHSVLTHVAQYGHLGVEIFFFLSGFLITSILKNEVHKTGNINLLRFYGRRMMRIFPAFYVYIFVVAILIGNSALAIHWQRLASAASFTWGYTVLATPSGRDDWFLVQFWSLAIEEQFYVLWPAGLITLGLRRASTACIIVFLLLPVSRILTYWLWPDLRQNIPVMLHTASDTLMLGCAASLLADNPRWKYFLSRANGSLALFAAMWLLLLSPLMNKIFGAYYKLCLGITIDSVMILVFVWYAATRSGSTIYKILNCGCCAYLGMWSYSIYVWSTFFFSPRITPWTLPYGGGFAVAIFVGVASYHLIEKPFLLLKERLTGVPDDLTVVQAFKRLEAYG